MATHKISKKLLLTVFNAPTPTESPDVLLKLLSSERDGSEHTREIIEYEEAVGTKLIELDKYEHGNVTVDQVVIQLNVNKGMDVEGGIGTKLDKTVPIAMLDMLLMKMVASTNTQGIYVVSTTGLDNLKIVFS